MTGGTSEFSDDAVDRLEDPLVQVRELGAIALDELVVVLAALAGRVGEPGIGQGDDDRRAVGTETVGWCGAGTWAKTSAGGRSRVAAISGSASRFAWIRSRSWPEPKSGATALTTAPANVEVRRLISNSLRLPEST